MYFVATLPVTSDISSYLWLPGNPKARRTLRQETPRRIPGRTPNLNWYTSPQFWPFF